MGSIQASQLPQSRSEHATMGGEKVQAVLWYMSIVGSVNHYEGANRDSPWSPLGRVMCTSPIGSSEGVGTGASVYGLP